MNKIITIGREFGSGGREIGLKLAEKLNIPFYDKEIITMTAEHSGLEEDFIANNEEGNSLIGTSAIGRMSFASFKYKPSFADGIFLHQCDVINKIAKEGPCVVVGRCADFVLKEQAISVFIAASMPYKIARKRGMAAEKANYDDSQMEKFIEDVDKTRRNYYEHYTNHKWGNIQNYHLCIHSDLVGIEGSVDTILAYLKAAEK